jgi:hypothetical protein
VRYEKEIKKICKQYNVSFELERTKKILGGIAFPWESKILVFYTSTTPKNVIFSILFHEIAHILCYRKKKYVVYNGPIWYKEKPPSKIAIKHFFKTALKAELEADKIGKELMLKHYPKMKFIGWYESVKNQRKFLKRLKVAKKQITKALKASQ